jgi:hypothetical protein
VIVSKNKQLNEEIVVYSSSRALTISASVGGIDRPEKFEICNGTGERRWWQRGACEAQPGLLIPTSWRKSGGILQEVGTRRSPKVNWPKVYRYATLPSIFCAR